MGLYFSKFWPIKCLNGNVRYARLEEEFERMNQTLSTMALNIIDIGQIIITIYKTINYYQIETLNRLTIVNTDLSEREKCNVRELICAINQCKSMIEKIIPKTQIVNRV